VSILREPCGSLVFETSPFAVLALLYRLSDAGLHEARVRRIPALAGFAGIAAIPPTRDRRT
jgi:hypothetical protein